MSDGWLQGGIFRAGPGGELPVVAVTRLPPGLKQQQRSRPRTDALRGEPGFGEREPDFTAGSVTGYRWWALDDRVPRSEPALLLGMHAAWQPGENTATCLEIPALHPAADVPARGCHCGFYAFWTVQPPYATGSLPQVLGVIEGYGRVRTGTKGFRCQTARILALHTLGDEAAAVTLGRSYPAARVYRELPAMLAEFPPDPYVTG